MKKSLSVLALLLFVFAVVFTFQSSSIKAYKHLTHLVVKTEGNKSPCVRVSVQGLYLGEDISMQVALATNSDWAASKKIDITRTGCLQKTYSSAGTIAITPNPRDMISKDVRNRRYFDLLRRPVFLI